ncbi:MAG TPA: arginine deiminase-related protein [Thermoanaerobaculia bacterium]|jgi:dimethylargininase
MFRHAIVRPPPPNFAEGLTTARLGAPALEKALEQHEEYCEALRRCGLTLIRLEADPDHPDSTFVEDTAVLTPRRAILTRLGAASRRGEVESIGKELGRCYPSCERIRAPGTVDGGDVCEAGDHFFIGISKRTNEEGAGQLADLLRRDGYDSCSVDIREIEGILHLKSGLAHLGADRLAVIDALADHEAFRSYDLLRVDPAEAYATNCVSVNEFVLVAAGYPRLETAVRNLGNRVIVLEMSEFQKMDGGLSCLSLRF